MPSNQKTAVTFSFSLCAVPFETCACQSSVAGGVNFLADMKVYKNYRMSTPAVREAKKNQYLQESRPYFHKVTSVFTVLEVFGSFGR